MQKYNSKLLISFHFLCRLFISSFGDKIAMSSKTVIGIYPLIAHPLQRNLNRKGKFHIATIRHAISQLLTVLITLSIIELLADFILKVQFVSQEFQYPFFSSVKLSPHTANSHGYSITIIITNYNNNHNSNNNNNAKI